MSTRVSEDIHAVSRNLVEIPQCVCVLGEGRRVGSLGRDLRRRFEAIRLTINGCVNFAGEINGCAAEMGVRVWGPSIYDEYDGGRFY